MTGVDSAIKAALRGLNAPRAMGTWDSLFYAVCSRGSESCVFSGEAGFGFGPSRP